MQGTRVVDIVIIRQDLKEEDQEMFYGVQLCLSCNYLDP